MIISFRKIPFFVQAIDYRAIDYHAIDFINLLPPTFYLLPLDAYGVMRLGPRNRNMTSLMLRPSSSMVRRSTPKPKPPWGGQP